MLSIEPKKIKLSSGDYYLVNRFGFSRSKTKYVIWLIGIVGIYEGLTSLYFESPLFVQGNTIFIGQIVVSILTSLFPFIVFGLGFIFWEFTLLRVLTKFQYNKLYKNDKAWEVKINDNEIFNKTEKYEATYFWSGFIDYKYNDKLLALYTNQIQCVPLPKSSFTDAEWSDLLSFVEKTVKKNK